MTAEDLRAAGITTALVTGGAGYLGGAIASALLERGCRVRVFDTRPPSLRHSALEVVEGDLRDPEQVRSAVRGVDVVFHTASVIDLARFAPRDRRRTSVDVNVVGTRNVLAGCRDGGVPRLVYTSSNNVIFDGTPIDWVDEERPYPAKHVDLYSSTKAQAEQEVLAAHGTGGLSTCAIRPSGIYGPGEEHHLPRLVAECASGRLVAVIGDGSAVSDWSYIDNLVHGHLLAAVHLTPGSPVGGQAYFINDGEYLNNYEFMRPMVEGMGFTFPRRRVPAKVAEWFAIALELVFRAVALPGPPVTQVEILKSSVSHPCSIEKARRDLGYEPVCTYAEAVDRTIPYCLDLLHRHEQVDRPHAGWWIAVVTGMTSFGLIAHNPRTTRWWTRNTTRAVPLWVYQLGFWAAVFEHVRKALKAVRMAEEAGLHKTSGAWGWQTFILGAPSSTLLKRRIARQGRVGTDGQRPGGAT